MASLQDNAIRSLIVFAAVRAFFLPTPLPAQVDSCDIHVTITGLRSDRGAVEVALYNSDNTFLGDSSKVFRVVDDWPGKGISNVVFRRAPFGTYAIAAFHDENMNRKMDKGVFGIPKEGYGFSNDAMGFMGAPSFDKAQFVCDRDSILVTIRMKY